MHAGAAHRMWLHLQTALSPPSSQRVEVSFFKAFLISSGNSWTYSSAVLCRQGQLESLATSLLLYIIRRPNIK